MLARHVIWDRVAGSLHGLLVGDALGCPVEGWTPAQIEAEYGRLEEMVESTGRNWRPLGLHSDDGQQALAVLDAICADPESPEQAFVDIIVALRDAAPQRAGRFGLHRGAGRNFRSTVRGLRSNPSKPYAHAKPSAGNGAAMRVAPVALWWRDNHPLRNRRVAQLSAVTHRDMRAISGALALSIAIGNVLVAHPPHVLSNRFLGEVRAAELAAAEQLGFEADTRFSQALAALIDERHSTTKLERLLEGIADRGQRLAGADRKVGPASGFAACSVLTALTIVDACTDFESSLTTAVNLGDDTDTVAAMVGALAGAKYGFEAIPRRWLEQLRATGVLLERIEQLVDTEPGACQPELIKLEQQWDALFDARPKKKLF